MKLKVEMPSQMTGKKLSKVPIVKTNSAAKDSLCKT